MIRRHALHGPVPRSLSRSGFTLLEVLVVIGLVAAITFIVAPRIGARLSSGLPGATDIMRAELGFAAQRAVSSGETHRLVIDLEKQRFRLEHTIRNDLASEAALPGSPALLDLRPPRREIEEAPVDDSAGEWRTLEIDDVRLALVRLGDQEITNELASISFSSDGGADPAEIVLVDQYTRAKRVRVLPFTAEIEIEDGLDD